MSAVAPSTRELARLDSAGKHAGLIKAHYPFWDSYFRPALLTAVERLPTDHFDFKPRPEMMTARQHILHIAEAELRGQRLEARPIVTLAADVDRNIGIRPARVRDGPQRKLHSFITLESANIQERWACGARRR